MDNVNHKTMTEAAALVWLADVFQESAETMKPERLREQIPMWDSLGVLTLMAELDEKFDVVVSDQEMRAMTKVGDVLSLLRQYGKLSS